MILYNREGDAWYYSQLVEVEALLIGRTFKLLIDHAPDQNFNDQAKLSRRQVCWLQVLAEYNVEFEYMPGRKHSILDALSRQPLLHNVLSIDSNKALQEAIAIAQKTSTDPTVTQHLLECMAVTEAGIAINQYLLEGMGRQGDGYTLKNGMLYKKDSNRVRIVVPYDALDLKQQILKELYESVLDGHLWARKLSRLVPDRFAWTGIESAVHDYCRQCSTC